MEIHGDFQTSVRRALSEIDSDYEKLDGLIICGSHSPDRLDIEFLLQRIRHARENSRPFLGICLGHQLGAIEYARNVLSIEDATSEEFGSGTFVVKKRRDGLNVGMREDGSYWNNYEVAIDWQKPDHFFTSQPHPEYESSIGNPHPLLTQFLKKCGSVK